MKKDKTVSIYALVCPDTDEYKYIGKTQTTLKQRLSNHLAEKENNRKSIWIQELLKSNKKPIIKLIEEVSIEEWELKEKYWIAHYGLKSLLNSSSGGKGLGKPILEVIEKFSEIQTERLKYPEYREKIFTQERSEKIKKKAIGRKKSKEHIAKLPQNQKGYKRNLSEETIEKLRRASTGNKNSLGKKTSNETKRKISESKKGNQNTKGRIMPEHEKKQRSIALKGKPKSEEWKQKLKLAAIKRWQKDKKCS
jgi:hypothetical protein